jgi:O-antigen/teichoic acid export membrane protein
MPAAVGEASGESDRVLGRLARSGFWSIVAHLCAAAATFAVGIIVARALGPGPFGRFSYYFWLLTLVPTLLALGVPAAITRSLPEYLGSGDGQHAFGVVRLALRLHAVMVVPVAAITIVGIWTSQHNPVLAVALAVGIALTLLSADIEGLLAGIHQFRTLTVFAIVLAGGQIAVAVLGYFADASWQGYIALLVAAQLVAVIVSVVVCRRHLAAARRGRLSAEQRQRFYRFAGMLAFGVTLNAILWGRPEVFFIARYRPSLDVGYYSTALRLSSLAAIVPLMAARGLVPEFARLRGARNNDVLTAVYPKICTLLAVLAAPLALGGAVLAGPTIRTVYGDSFAPATTTLVILSIGSIVNAIAGPSTAIVITGPRPRLMVEAGTAMAAVNIIIDILVIPHHGIAGAAVVNVSVQAASVGVGIGYGWWKLGLRYPVARVARIGVLAFASAMAAWGVTQVVGGGAGLLLAIAAGAVVYIGLLAATSTVTLDELRSLLTRPDTVATVATA